MAKYTTRNGCQITVMLLTAQGTKHVDWTNKSCINISIIIELNDNRQ